MPGGDGTGPAGMGPMTGRAAGYCAGYPMPGYVNPVSGRGVWGRGRAWFGRSGGRGWRNWYGATGMPGWPRAAQGDPAFGSGGVSFFPPEMTPKEETDMLKSQADVLKQQLEDIQSRIGTLEKAQAQEKK